MTMARSTTGAWTGASPLSRRCVRRPPQAGDSTRRRASTASGRSRGLTTSTATKWRCATGECKPAPTCVKADRLHPLVPRDSQRSRKLYRSRGAVEREFGRLNHEWALLPLRVRGLDRVRLHADLTILAKLAVALTRARAALPLAYVPPGHDAGPAVDPVRLKGASPRRAGRMVGVEPLSGRDHWPQGQYPRTLLLSAAQRERVSLLVSLEPPRAMRIRRDDAAWSLPLVLVLDHCGLGFRRRHLRSSYRGR